MLVGQTLPVSTLAASLEARDLVKQYKRVRAVDGISLRVGEGERVGLLGPNGAGKTTTLLMLLGVVTPDSGTVEVLGRSLPKERSAAMQHVGFAAGYVPLPDKLKVREVLDIFGELYGMADPSAAIELTLARLRIPHLAEAMCGELSSGQKTLVGIAKAILHRPRLLVLDEPTASLDPDVAYRVRLGLGELCAEDNTSLLVTSHNMAEVERLCERVVFISGGKVVADDTPAAVADQFGHGSLEDVFLELAGTLRSAEELEAEGLTDLARGDDRRLPDPPADATGPTGRTSRAEEEPA